MIKVIWKLIFLNLKLSYHLKLNFISDCFQRVQDIYSNIGELMAQKRQARSIANEEFLDQVEAIYFGSCGNDFWPQIQDSQAFKLRLPREHDHSW